MVDWILKNHIRKSHNSNRVVPYDYYSEKDILVLRNMIINDMEDLFGIEYTSKIVDAVNKRFGFGYKDNTKDK